MFTPIYVEVSISAQIERYTTNLFQHTAGSGCAFGYAYNLMEIDTIRTEVAFTNALTDGLLLESIIYRFSLLADERHTVLFMCSSAAIADGPIDITASRYAESFLYPPRLVTHPDTFRVALQPRAHVYDPERGPNVLTGAAFDEPAPYKYFFDSLPVTLRLEWTFPAVRTVNATVTLDYSDIGPCFFGGDAAKTNITHEVVTTDAATGYLTFIFACSQMRFSEILKTRTTLGNATWRVQRLRLIGRISLTAITAEGPLVLTDPELIVEFPLSDVTPLHFAFSPALPTAAVLELSFSNPTAECIFLEFNDESGSAVITATTASYTVNIKCNSPAFEPPQVIAQFATGSGVYYQDVKSAALQTKGDLVFTINNQPIEAHTSFVVGQIYTVVAQFAPTPTATQTVMISQLTTPADCVFQLRGTGLYTREPVFVQINTIESFTANMMCRRTHSVGSHITISSNAYKGSAIGPVPVYGLMAFDYVMPATNFGADREITDLDSRDNFELLVAPSGSAALLSPYYMRTPNTNVTSVRLRMIPAVLSMTTVRISFTSMIGMCGFMIYSDTGVPTFSSTVNVLFVLGDAVSTIYPSCSYTTASTVMLLAEVTSGNVHLPVLSLPLHVRGSILFSTEQVESNLAFTGEIVANRDWVFTVALAPYAAESTTLFVDVLADSLVGPQPTCAFRLLADTVAFENLTYGAFEFTFNATTLAIDIAMSCSVETELNPAVILITNSKDTWYDVFRSAPFRVRGAVWIEDSKALRTVAFPPLATPTTLKRVAVQLIHNLRVRLMPAPTHTAVFDITSSSSDDCKLATTNVTDPILFSDSLLFSVASSVSEVDLALYCVRANPSVKLTIISSATTYFSQFTTVPFAVENRFTTSTLPEAIHAQEPKLITMSFLPMDAVNGVGRFVRVAITVDSSFTNCFGAPLNTITGGKPDNSTWVSLSGGKLELTAAYATSFDFWFKCMTFTHRSDLGLVDDAVLPRVVVTRLLGITFMSFTSEPIRVTLIDCQTLGTIIRGSVTYQDNGFGLTFYKAEASVSCNSGYTLISPSNASRTCTVNPATNPPVTTCTQSMTCLATGWSAQAPTCEVFNCGPVPQRYPTFGTTPKQTEIAPEGNATSFGARYTYGCIDGFVLAGSQEITCSAGGWSSPTAPACVPIECPVLLTTNNVGNITYSTLPYGARKFQSIATQECLELYVRTDGDEKRVCQANQTWSGTAAICRSNTCVRIYHEPTTMKPIVFTRYGSNVTYDSGSNTYPVDTIASYACAEGYMWERDLAYTTRKCVLSEGWEPIDSPRCVPQPCPTLSTVAFGAVVQAPSSLMNMYGVTATFSCEYGAVMSHTDSQIICTATGNWSGPLRTCSPYNCGAPGSIPFAQVSVANNGTHGSLGMYLNTSLVEYRCNAGYNLRYSGYNLTDGTGYVVQFIQQSTPVLAARRECTPLGWVPLTLPACDVHQCESLQVPINGANIVFEDTLGTGNNGVIARSYGTTATYVCKPGYEPRDPLTDTVTSAKRRCGSLADGWLPAVGPMCGAIDCKRPDKDGIVPYSKEIEFKYDDLIVAGPTRYQSIAVYRCMPGFTFAGGSDRYERTCTEASQWLPAVPACIDIDECDPDKLNGKYFVDCAAVYGSHSRCINTFGSYVCTPQITLDIVPMSVPWSDGVVNFNVETHELIPNHSHGSQTVKFTLNAGVNVVAPYVARVQYLNTNATLYSNAAIVTYECTDILVMPVLNQEKLKYLQVQCTLSAGQGADLYVRMQYCIQPDAVANNAGDVDCSRWNWAWDGTSALAELATLGSNYNVRISYPLHAFVPSSLHAVTSTGIGQRTNDYVSLTSLGEDIGFDIDNLFVERAGLVRMMYSAGSNTEDYPHECIFNQELSLTNSPNQRTIICHTKDGVNEIDLKFKLIIAHRAAYSTDMYSYPQVPLVSSVFGCGIDNFLSGITSDCPTDGGDIRLTVTGSGFLDPLQVMVGGRQCLSLLRESNLKLTCKLPAGSGSGLSLIVKAGSQRVESRGRVNYAAPSITEIRGCQKNSIKSIRECNRDGGDRILLLGDNFGAFGAAVSIGGLTCSQVVHTDSNPHRELMCTTPADATIDRPVTVLQRYGELSKETVLLSYVQCPPGQHNSDVKCVPCEPGYYNDIWSQALCRQCQPGTFTDQYGATACSDCPVGTYSGLGQSSCPRCPRGTFSQKRAEGCLQCAPGTFAEHEGSAQCETCPLGAEHTSDYSFCQCKAGSYRDIMGVCQPCMLGGDCSMPGVSVYNILSILSYAPSITYLNPPNVVRVYFPISIAYNTSRVDVSRTAQSLVIKAIFDSNSRPRSRFVFASVLDILPDSVLEGANVGTKASETIEDKLRTFYVMVDVNPSIIESDPSAQELADDAISDYNAQKSILLAEQVYIKAPIIDANYKRHAVLSFQTCLDSTCVGGNACIEGHSGPLCTVCSPGYGKTSVFKCGRCNEPALAWFIIVASTLAAIVGCAVLAWKQIVDGRQSMNELPAPAVPLLFKVAVSGLQVMAIANKYDLRWPGFLNGLFSGADSAAGVGTALVSLDCFLGDNPSINSFWVTSIGIMVLPVMGIILPFIFFMPRYYITKRRYKMHVLAEMAEQRHLMAEIVTEFESYARQRDRVMKAQDQVAAAERSKDYVTSGVWDNVDDTHDMGLLSDALTARNRPTGFTNSVHTGIDLSTKESAGVHIINARKTVGKRRQLMRKSSKKPSVSLPDETGPLAPPVPPTTPEFSTQVSGYGAPRTPLHRRRTGLPSVSRSNSVSRISSASVAQQIGVNRGSAQHIFAPPPGSPVGGPFHRDESPMRVSYGCRGFRATTASPARTRDALLEERGLRAVTTDTVQSGNCPHSGDSPTTSALFGIMRIASDVSNDNRSPFQRVSALLPGRGVTMRVCSSSAVVESASEADVMHPFNYDVMMTQQSANTSSVTPVLSSEQAGIATRTWGPSSKIHSNPDRRAADELDETSDIVVFEHNDLVDENNLNSYINTSFSDRDAPAVSINLTPPLSGMQEKHDAVLPVSGTKSLPETRGVPYRQQSLPFPPTGSSVNNDATIQNSHDDDPSAIANLFSSVLCDDAAFILRSTLIDEAQVSEAALSRAYALMHQSRESIYERVAREVEVYSMIVRETPEFNAKKSKEAENKATSTFEFARVVQSAEDLENMRLLSTLPFDSLYNAELLRDRVLRRERAFQRVRAEQQQQWYVGNYGEKDGKAMFEKAREQRLKSEPPKLTASEMRVRLDVAETQYNNIIS